MSSLFEVGYENDAGQRVGICVAGDVDDDQRTVAPGGGAGDRVAHRTQAVDTASIESLLGRAEGHYRHSLERCGGNVDPASEGKCETRAD